MAKASNGANQSPNEGQEGAKQPTIEELQEKLEAANKREADAAAEAENQRLKAEEAIKKNKELEEKLAAGTSGGQVTETSTAQQQYDDEHPYKMRKFEEWSVKQKFKEITDEETGELKRIKLFGQFEKIKKIREVDIDNAHAAENNSQSTNSGLRYYRIPDGKEL